MRKTILLALMAVFLLTGCVAGQGSVRGLYVPTGLLYSHVRMPLMVNYKTTKVTGSHGSSGSVLEINIQPWVHVSWESNAIGDIARESGMKEVYFADLEELRVLGFWATHTVHIYGALEGGAPAHLEVPSR